MGFYVSYIRDFTVSCKNAWAFYNWTWLYNDTVAESEKNLHNVQSLFPKWGPVAVIWELCHHKHLSGKCLSN